MTLPQRLRRFLAILDARNKEFLRDRQAMGWNLALPLLIVVGFAFVFSGGNRDVFKVGVYGPEAPARAGAFLALEHIQFIPMDSLETAILKVQRHQIDLLVAPAEGRYWVNDNSERGYLVERLLLSNIAKAFSHETVSGREIRYVDWVWPGVLAMNIMFSALFGALFSLHDPGEKPLAGSTLHARYGDGVFIYTGLSFFRQLPDGVPGAYRLFANFLSAGLVQ